jgi:hypothetical protein
MYRALWFTAVMLFGMLTGMSIDRLGAGILPATPFTSAPEARLAAVGPAPVAEPVTLRPVPTATPAGTAAPAEAAAAAGREAAAGADRATAAHVPPAGRAFVRVGATWVKANPDEATTTVSTSEPAPGFVRVGNTWTRAEAAAPDAEPAHADASAHAAEPVFVRAGNTWTRAGVTARTVSAPSPA